MSAALLQSHVYDIYDRIAPEFDRTRHTPWPGVQAFLAGLPTGATVLDVGCGNGKYLNLRPDCQMFGCDPCASLITAAAARAPTASVQVGNGLDLPYQTGSMDAVYSIAVLHHMPTVALRRQMLAEIRRVLRPGGTALITVWDRSAVRPSWAPMAEPGDYEVGWSDAGPRYYHVFSETEINSLVSEYFTVTGVRWERENWYVYVTRTLP